MHQRTRRLYCPPSLGRCSASSTRRCSDETDYLKHTKHRSESCFLKVITNFFRITLDFKNYSRFFSMLSLTFPQFPIHFQPFQSYPLLKIVKAFFGLFETLQDFTVFLFVIVGFGSLELFFLFSWLSWLFRIIPNIFYIIALFSELFTGNCI